VLHTRTYGYETFVSGFVKKCIVKAIQKGKLHINKGSYNRVLKGDPFKGKNKVLQVDYEMWGKKETIEKKESQSMTLPDIAKK